MEKRRTLGKAIEAQDLEDKEEGNLFSRSEIKEDLYDSIPLDRNKPET